MHHTVKVGFTRGDIRAYAHWDGNRPCSLETANDLPNFRLSIVDQRQQRLLHTMTGAFAVRLFCILDERLRDVRDSDFNCFAAVDTLAEGAPIRSDIHWRAPLPLEFSDGLTTPYRFQCEGPYAMPMADGDWRETYGIIHEGIVLADDGDQAIVFHKPGPLRPHIDTLAGALLSYRRTVRLRYGSLLTSDH